jgi:hypothetical protein
MCWLYDIEAAVTPADRRDDSAITVVEDSITPGSEQIKLIDLEMLVGNLYAAKPKPPFDKEIDKNSAGKEIFDKHSGVDFRHAGLADKGLAK